jgi:hypothetical protein
MTRWEYLTVKLHEFGGEEAELKRHNEYWVSEYGMLDIMHKLGEEGWEAVCTIGRDLVFKRPILDTSSKSAVVDIRSSNPTKAGR